MDEAIDLDIASEIVEMLIAQEVRKGTSLDDPIFNDLMNIKNEILKNNTEMIEFVMSNYEQAVNLGENNDN